MRSRCSSKTTQLRESLAAIRSALTGDGRFVFETRNPLAREWERWTPDNAVEVVHHGHKVRMAHQVETPVNGDRVSFTVTFTSPGWDRPPDQSKYAEVP